MNHTKKKTRNLFNQLKLWGFAVLLLSVTTGCTFKVKLVGEYDLIVDQTVTELQQTTMSFFANMKVASKADRTYSKNKIFYAEVDGMIASLIIRSEVIEAGLKKTSLTKNFKALKAQYTELANEHKNNPSKIYFESAGKSFNQSFRAILEHLLYLKWNQSQPETSGK